MSELIRILKSSADEIESSVSGLIDSVSLDVSEREDLSFYSINYYCDTIRSQLSSVKPIFPELQKDERYIKLVKDGLQKYKRRFPFLGRWGYDSKIVENIIVPNANEISTVLRLYAEAEDRHYQFLSVPRDDQLSKLKLIKKPLNALEEKLAELKDVIFNEDVKSRVDNVLKPLQTMLGTYTMKDAHDEIGAWLDFFDKKYESTDKLEKRFYNRLKQFHDRLTSDIESFRAL